LRFIVGKWAVDYVVNAWSNDLRHIPASEWKSDDGSDLSALCFEFFEDRTVKLTDASRTREHTGEWEQTGYAEYRYTFGEFFDLPEGAFRDNVEKLLVQDGHLVFSIGFLAFALKKTEDGVVTPSESEVDIGEAEPSEEDLLMTGIVGRYEVAEAMSFANGDFEMHSREAVAADLEKRIAAGEIERDEAAGEMRAFDAVIEFFADHTVKEWMKLPDGVSDEEIKEALEAGEIGEVKDGMFVAGEKEWKALGGRYYYNTGEYREIFGEVKSPWDELVFGDDGLLAYGEMMRLRRID
jgi:hypothetical protein